MSNCRIERKRAHDREAQRASRAKTKAYISHLEKTVADLTQGTEGSRAKYLADHASKQSQEIDTLRGLVSKIRTMLQDATKQEFEYPNSYHDDTQSATTSSDSGDGHRVSVPVRHPRSAVEYIPSEDQGHAVNFVTLDRGAGHLPLKSIHRDPIIFGVRMKCEDSLSTVYAPKLNTVIAKLEQMSGEDFSQEDTDQDIIVRAIVFGWDEAERVHHFDVGWKFLRAFDEGLWYRAGPIERMVNCLNIRSMLLFKLQPKNQKRRSIVPGAAPTLQQQATPNRPPLVDYFVWPEVRNQILDHGLERHTGKSAIALTEAFAFQWSYEVRDAYRIERSTGMYSLSETFLARCQDLSSYRVNADPSLAYRFSHLEMPSIRTSDYDDQAADAPKRTDVETSRSRTTEYGEGAVVTTGTVFEPVSSSETVNHAFDASGSNCVPIEQSSWMTHTAAGIDHSNWIQSGPNWMSFNEDLVGDVATQYALDAFSIGQAQWTTV